MKSFEATPDKHDGGAESFITKGTPPGQARPEKPGDDRMEEMCTGMGMTPPARIGPNPGPGQGSSYNLPVKRTSSYKKPRR